MKGVLNVKGEDRRQVFHGVHMMFDAQAGAALGHGAARATAWCSSAADWTAPSSKPASNPPSRSISHAAKTVAVLRAGAARRRVARRLRRRMRLVAGRQAARDRGRRGQGRARAPRGRLCAATTIGEHMLGTLALAWQPRAQRFATSGQDGAVALWDAATGDADQALEARAGADAGAGILAGRRAARERAPARSVTLWSPDGRKGARLCTGREHGGRHWPSTGRARISGLP